MADHSDASPLIAPSPITETNEIDLEAGPGEQIQCRICLETDGRDFIAPCSAKAHQSMCTENVWIIGELSAYPALLFQEGFAFAHCTTCKAPYHLRVIASLAYLVYLIDGYQQSWIRHAWRLIARLVSTTYVELYCFSLCLGYLDASLLVMIKECAIWLSLAENYVFVAASLVSVLNVIYLALFVCGPTVPHALKVVLVWQCFGGYHGWTTDMAATLSHTSKRMLTKEYVVEDVDGEITGSDWSPHLSHLNMFNS
ncbi:hypothetical protein FNV43_RR18460 [Rhamnella rubrinervis]|uniref:RING-CH-type domain-containing protein n=1 Tax=Rhamnella rubrinervis TaxID=2594499 RepID=A0A8K0E0S8_9ROSA|nr:hypothetical protein FNV43_RR18460 [Rhamnella rubrinervis]